MSPIDLPLSRRRALHLPLAYGLAACAGAGQAQAANQAPLLANGVLEIIALPPARIELYFADTLSPEVRAEALAWVTRSAQTTAAYLGRFPVNNPKITLMPVSGRGISSGVTFNGPPPSIRVQVGKDTTRAGFLDDWIMVHEMVHLAIPQLPRQNNWFHEGAATYVEIIARAQAGLTSWDTVWSQLITRMHQGQPQAGDNGLDNTRTWGRTYWGGALFCLLADVEIRKRSNNRMGLQDALAGLVKSGASYAQSWTLQRTLEAADQATGQTVLAEQYAAMKDAPVAADLPQLWADMGISLVGNRVALREDAPLAGARRAIARGNSAQAA
ncbi:MAG: hypothetical protein ACKVOO_01935 [Burkholderiaceae bacterium]